MNVVILYESNTTIRGGGGAGGGELPYKWLMGTCHWFRLHFHHWIDFNGSHISTELLDLGCTFSDFLGQESSSYLQLANLYCKVFFIGSKNWVNS